MPKTDETSNAGSLDLAVAIIPFRNAIARVDHYESPRDKAVLIAYELNGPYFELLSVDDQLGQGRATEKLLVFHIRNLINAFDRAAQHTPADAPAPQAQPAPSLDDVRREARRLALEEAAKIAEDYQPGVVGDQWVGIKDETAEYAASNIAEKIRAAADPVRGGGDGT